MLEEVYSSYKKLADEINWKEYNSNDLFFEYIKNENNELGEKFYAGIVCRYWGYTGRIYLQCNKHLPFEQCYDILIDTINYVLEKRVWENPESSLFLDKKGPDKAFHLVLKRQRSILLSNIMAYKRKTNFNSLSLDEIHEKYNDAAEGLFNIYYTSENEDDLVDFIKSWNDPLKIAILDTVCFSNWIRLKNIVKIIKNLDNSQSEYYQSKYGISSENYNNLISKIGTLTDSSLLMEVKRLLYIIREELR